NLLCSAGTDNTIKLWDIRQFTVPLLIMTGHSQSVRQIKFDPHTPSYLASCSYDFTVRLWDTANPLHPLIQTISHHNEFTYSVDFSVYQKGLSTLTADNAIKNIMRTGSINTSFHYLKTRPTEIISTTAYDIRICQDIKTNWTLYLHMLRKIFNKRKLFFTELSHYYDIKDHIRTKYL
uniref:Peroxin-7 n=1 Tax=Amphimedon queenslandica TaxID=400682 RepID=A0A1X7UIA1_AMPQE